MPGAVMRAGKWRIKPSGKLPIFLRYMINSSFTTANAEKANFHHTLPNRVYLNHMMYWEKEEYGAFETEIINHMTADDGWFERYCEQELKKSEELYLLGLEYKKINWREKSDQEMSDLIKKLFQQYRELACPWYAQYPMDEYFESTIEKKLLEYIPANDPDFRKYVLIFTDPKEMTEVSEERWKLTQIAKTFFEDKENLDNLSETAKEKINQHLKKFAYI